MSEEAKQLTLVANLVQLPAALVPPPDGYVARETRLSDLEGLASLYFAAYPRRIVATQDDAFREIKATFEGEYGELDLQGSPVLTNAGAIVASVMTVTRAPWPDTPPGPFFIEVIVDPAHRRKGLARYAVLRAAAILRASGRESVGLRVMSDNEGALGLYAQLGFDRWDQR